MTQDKPNTLKSNHPAQKNKRKRTPRRITESYLHNSGLYYLERFSSSSENFRKVMTRKIDKSCFAHTDQDRDKCIEMLSLTIKKFERLGLLDDKTYTVTKVNALRRKGLSARMIAIQLTAKGLDKELIQNTIYEHNKLQEDDSETIAAIRLARRKKIGPFRTKEPDEKTYEKSLAALARAGYSYDIAQTVLNLTAEEAEELLY